MTLNDPTATASNAPRLGAFIGVFTPTVLTILGVIMYLRLGWVVGNAGLYGTLLIVVFSNSITFLTALSLSALATNMRVGVGGAYYLISRSLGLEVGGAIGIPLYLSQALSVTLYCFGLAEVLLSPWPNAPTAPVAGVLILAVGAFAGRSTAWALKAQLPIMALIFLSIASLLFGVDWGGSQVAAFEGGGQDGYWNLFAVFFPAVTGILAGVSLSGDLADPGKAIPRGGIAAILVGFVIYMVLPIALANGASKEMLLDEDTMVWTQVAYLPLLVVPGMVGAILSSAVGSILGAPRTLQALALDRLAPRMLAQVDEQTGEPLTALRLTTGVALAAVLLGDLNAVATVLTMFFLTTYGMLNLVAGIEELVGDPSFRPRIRVPWWASFLGAIGCLIAMFAISPLACGIAIVIEGALYFFLRRRSLESAFGDVRGGMLLTATRFALLRLRDTRVDPRNWRPHILVFTTDLESRLDTVQMADALSQHRGITTVVSLLVGDVEESDNNLRLVRQHNTMLENRGVLAFCEVIQVPQLIDGVMTVAQANGFAGLDSNTIMFGWPGEDAEALGRLLALSRKVGVLHKCTLIHRPAPRVSERTNRVVVWWKGREHNGDLMLLLAHLVSLAPEWRNIRIVLKSVVEKREDIAVREQEFAEMLPSIRIDAEVDVVIRPPDLAIAEVIRQHSRSARLVFVGLPPAPVGQEAAVAKGLLGLLEGLPETVLVRNEGPFRGRLV